MVTPTDDEKIRVKVRRSHTPRLELFTFGHWWTVSLPGILGQPIAEFRDWRDAYAMALLISQRLNAARAGQQTRITVVPVSSTTEES